MSRILEEEVVREWNNWVLRIRLLGALRPDQAYMKSPCDQSKGQHPAKLFLQIKLSFSQSLLLRLLY